MITMTNLHIFASPILTFIMTWCLSYVNDESSPLCHCHCEYHWRTRPRSMCWILSHPIGEGLRGGAPEILCKWTHYIDKFKAILAFKSSSIKLVLYTYFWLNLSNDYEYDNHDEGYDNNDESLYIFESYLDFLDTKCSHSDDKSMIPHCRRQNHDYRDCQIIFSNHHHGL